MRQFAMRQNVHDNAAMQKKPSGGATVSVAKVLQAFRKDAAAMAGVCANGGTLQAADMAMDEEALQMKPVVQFQPEEDEALQMKPVAQLQAEEDEALQMKPVAQLQAEDDEALQMKPVVQLQAEDEEVLQGKFETLQKKPNNTGLPDTLKSGVERMSGLSMDDVKVHYNSDKPAQMQAHAYTQGTDIHVASGQEKHLPHEAWHVVQQKQGRVQPTLQMQGVGVNDDNSLESEADTMGAKATSWGNTEGEMRPFATRQNAHDNAAMQKKPFGGATLSIGKVLQPFRNNTETMAGIHGDGGTLQAKTMQTVSVLKDGEALQGKFDTIQQKQGYAQPTLQLQCLGVNDDISLERGADTMGGKAVQTVQMQTFITQNSHTNLNKTVQLYKGATDETLICTCVAHVYAKGADDVKKSAYGAGGNERDAADAVKNTFNEYRLNNLYELDHIKKGGNVPGSCAEPHAVADALGNGIDKGDDITTITVTPTVLVKPREKQVKGDVLARCETCKQWILGTVVKNHYIMQGDQDVAHNPAITPPVQKDAQATLRIALVDAILNIKVADQQQDQDTMKAIVEYNALRLALARPAEAPDEEAKGFQLNAVDQDRLTAITKAVAPTVTPTLLKILTKTLTEEALTATKDATTAATTDATTTETKANTMDINVKNFKTTIVNATTHPNTIQTVAQAAILIANTTNDRTSALGAASEAKTAAASTITKTKNAASVISKLTLLAVTVSTALTEAVNTIPEAGQTLKNAKDTASATATATATELSKANVEIGKAKEKANISPAKITAALKTITSLNTRFTTLGTMPVGSIPVVITGIITGIITTASNAATALTFATATRTATTATNTALNATKALPPVGPDQIGLAAAAGPDKAALTLALNLALNPAQANPQNQAP